MADVISAPANEVISVINECNDPEINAMALRMKENYQKTASTQLSTSPVNDYMNRVSRTVNLTIASISQKNKQEKLPKDSEDIKSIYGKFSWRIIARYYVPYIIRVINGEKLKFVSVRMAETQLLSDFIHCLHADVYKCTSVRSYFITDSEAKILNEINIEHSDGIYGNDTFCAGKDYIVSLEDVHEFYTFIKVCYKKLQCKKTSLGQKCGFISINSESVVPYCLKDGHKYVPLFYFEDETENLRHCAVKLENWNLAYLKFCCKVQGIRYELYTSDSCTVTSLDDIKNYFPPETRFEDYWPAKLIDTQLLKNQNSTHVNPPGAWIRAPSEVPAPQSTIPHSLTASAPVMPQSTSVVMNTFQNGWPANQMGPPMSQGNSLMNGVNRVISSSPLVRVNNTAPVIDDTMSYSITVPISQCMTIMYNPVPSSSVKSHSNQTQQFYNQCPSNSSQAQQQQVQQQQQQKPQQQQQIITTPQVQPYSGATSVHGCLTNTQQRNAFGNIAPIVITPATAIIDLSSPPSSPAPTLVQDAPLRPNVELELKQIPELMLTQNSDSINNVAYKIQKERINGKVINCINAKPHIYSDFVMTIHDLIQMLLPSYTVKGCGKVLKEFFNINLINGNSEQVNVLKENGLLRSTCTGFIPMVKLQDITRVLPQLKSLLSNQDQSAAGPSKRHRNS